jgi:cellulose synthase operon protein C
VPCPDLETLAAVVDGTVSAEEHQTVAAHLALCEECRAIVGETVYAAQSLGVGLPALPVVEPSTPVVHLGGRARAVRMAIGLLAAAAMLVVAVRFAWNRAPERSGAGVRSEVAELVAAVGPSRLMEPRLTGGFRYGPLTPVFRAADSAAPAAAAVRVAAAKIESAARRDRTPAAKTAFAAAELVVGRVDSAISLLDAVVSQVENDPGPWNDLAAALLVRALRTGDARSAERALEAADRALGLAPSMPEALFNRALALEAIGREQDAHGAWTAYLTADPDSPWAADVRRRIGTGFQ